MVGCLSPKKFCWLNLNRQIYMSNPTCFPVNFRCLSVGHHKKNIFTAERPWIRSDKLTMFPAEKRPQCSVCLKTGYIPQMLMVNPPFRPEHGFNMVSGYCNHHAFHIFPMKNTVNTSFITMFSETYRKITHIFSIFSGFSGQKLQVDLQLRLAYLQRLGPWRLDHVAPWEWRPNSSMPLSAIRPLKTCKAYDDVVPCPRWGKWMKVKIVGWCWWLVYIYIIQVMYYI